MITAILVKADLFQNIVRKYSQGICQKEKEEKTLVVDARNGQGDNTLLLLFTTHQF